MTQQQADSIGYTIGYLIPILAVLGIGLFFGFRLGAKREPRRFVWWPILIALALVGFSVLGSFGNRNSQKASASSSPDVQVDVIESKAPPGAVLLRLDSKQEAALKSRLINSARDQLTKVKESTAGINAEVGYFLDKPQKLITAVVSTDEGIIEAHIIALKDGKQFEIVCIPNEQMRKAFRLSMEQCGERTKAALGASYAELLELKHG